MRAEMRTFMCGRHDVTAAVPCMSYVLHVARNLLRRVMMMHENRERMMPILVSGRLFYA